MKRFRIATYNIHKARGLDARVRVERIARVLAAIDADVIALQEVVSRDGPSIEDHQAGYLADRLGYRYAIGETRKHRGGVYGNVTLSRWDFEMVRHCDLSVTGREERGVLRTDIRIGQHVSGQDILHIFNVHLRTGHRERRTQALHLVDETCGAARPVPELCPNPICSIRGICASSESRFPRFVGIVDS
jgi:endonuclease/exonuclease/phosphatase family metal-dependent hydrolase